MMKSLSKLIKNLLHSFVYRITKSFHRWTNLNVSITWNFRTAYRLTSKRTKKKAWMLKLKTSHEKEFHANFTKSLCPGKAWKNWNKKSRKMIMENESLSLSRWMCKSELPSLTRFSNTSDSTLTSFPVVAGQSGKLVWGGSIKKNYRKDIKHWFMYCGWIRRCRSFSHSFFSSLNLFFFHSNLQLKLLFVVVIIFRISFFFLFRLYSSVIVPIFNRTSVIPDVEQKRIICDERKLFWKALSW